MAQRQALEAFIKATVASNDAVARDLERAIAGSEDVELDLPELPMSVQQQRRTRAFPNGWKCSPTSSSSTPRTQGLGRPGRGIPGDQLGLGHGQQIFQHLTVSRLGRDGDVRR